MTPSAFNPAMGPIKKLYDEGKVAIIQGIGYPNPSRSHFRSMDIWHTCEPDKVGTEGWLGRAIRDIDPQKDNVLTGVNFGRGLPQGPGGAWRAGGLGGQSGDLRCPHRYRGRGPALKALGYCSPVCTRRCSARSGAGILRPDGSGCLERGGHPQHGPAEVYLDGEVRQRYRGPVYEEHRPDASGRTSGRAILYTTAPYNSFDTHASELANHTQLWTQTCPMPSVPSTMTSKSTMPPTTWCSCCSPSLAGACMTTALGPTTARAVIAFVIGDAVKGGLYGEYPSLAPEKLLEGDLHYNNDFRGTYATLLEQWMGLDSKPIVGGSFEQLDFLYNR